MARVYSPSEIGDHRICRLMIFFFRIYGIWFTETTSWLYHTYRYSLHFVFTFCYTFFACARLVQLSDLSELISASGMSLTLVALCVKLINLNYSMKEVQFLLRQCEQFPLTSTKEVKLVSDRVRFFTILAYGYYVVANMAGLTSYTSGWYTRRLPFAGWYPGLDAGRSYTEFVYLYVYQVVGMLMLSAVNITMELFPSYIMYLLSVKMEVIGGRIADLGRGLDNQREYEIESDEPELIEMEEQLRSCVQTHQELCRTIAIAERVFWRGFFAQICFSGIIICCYAFLLTFTSPRDDIFAYMFYVTFLCSMVAQIFIPNYFGNEVMLRSEQMSNWAYSSGWPQTDRQFRRILIIFLERVKRRATITVGKMFPLSLDTFTSIISFAYKLYAVLAK